MNIFALSKSPQQSAIEMLDKHIVKMPTETCQMLHTNILYMQYIRDCGKEPQLKDLKRFHKQIGSKLMKPAMLNHPSTIWARQSGANFHWLYQHGMALCEEYSLRYGKRHGSHDRIIYGIWNWGCDDYIFPNTKLTPVTIAMADEYRIENTFDDEWDFVIESYRHYYLEGKWQFAEWKTQKPVWWPKNHIVRKHNERIVRYNALGKTQLKLLEEEEE